MEEDVILRGDFADFFQRLNDAELIVGVHDGDQGGLRTNGIADGFGIDEAVFVDGEISHFDGAAGIFFQELTGIENGFVFDLSGDDVFGGARSVANDAEDGVIVGFGAATGEDDLLWARAEKSCDLFAGGFYPCASALAGSMDGGGVAEVGGKIGKHGVDDRGFDGGGGVVIEVDAGHRDRDQYT